MNIFDSVKETFFSKSFIAFLIIGIVNTIVGLTITFTCYNVLGLNYWTSSALDYFFASILSYYLNKRFTFHYQGADIYSILKFAINIIVCYLIAFSLARPCTQYLLEIFFRNELSKTLIENVAMLVGTGFFMVINYLGQKFFAFKKMQEES